MMNIIRGLALFTATLASTSVSAVEQEKDRCALEQASKEKMADCIKLPRKNATRLHDLTRRNKGLLPER
jgi:hypothetical protein